MVRVFERIVVQSHARSDTALAAYGLRVHRHECERDRRLPRWRSRCLQVRKPRLAARLTRAISRSASRVTGAGGGEYRWNGYGEYCGV